MGRNDGGSKVPAFCLARIRPQVRVKSPVVALPKPVSVNQLAEADQKAESKEHCSAIGGGEATRNGSENNKNTSGFAGRKIMIVVDSSAEAKGALQWALTHTVQDTDLVTLLYVVSDSEPSNQGRELSKEELPSKVEGLLKSMKKLCQSTKPEVEVELQVVAGKDKGPAIVEEAKRKGTGMLVVGQTKRSTTLRLLMMWTSKRSDGLTVPDYCIQNAPCMAVAARRKSKRHGGYLITTKRHKDFWLLA
uniref:UspA domain-containing protein n=1 Tax=Kalanchoe fedtschenkoi TaxID=63787 RepID=A0A7N0UDH2_KALFE